MSNAQHTRELTDSQRIRAEETERIIAERDALRRERDELRAALEAFLAGEKCWNIYPIAGTHNYPDRMPAGVKGRARAALAHTDPQRSP